VVVGSIAIASALCRAVEVPAVRLGQGLATPVEPQELEKGT